MKRHLLIKVTLLLITFLGCNECFSQSDWNIVKEAKTLPSINNRATVKGFAFDTPLYISKDSLNNGFTVALEDASFKIVVFLLTYDCEDCDIWEKTIYGNIVTMKDAPILKSLKRGDILSFGLFKVEKGGKHYTIPETNIIVADLR